MRKSRLFAWLSGGTGVFALLCCVLPILPVLLGAASLSGLLSVVYRDSVLLPIAAIAFAFAGGALWLDRRST